jgi:3-deoxy-D-manno-octulosonic-acid transferase
VLLVAVLVLGAPWWLARMALSGRYRAGLAGRLGFVPTAVRAAGEGSVWVHAVSVGEVLAAQGVIEGLRGAGYRVVVSTTTQAGQELARRRFEGCVVFYMPLDVGVWIGRYLGVLRPRMVVTMESELWPNLIHGCWKRGIALVVVNARVSDRSFPRYMRLRAVWGPLLREVRMFLAQGEATAERLVRMGVSADRVRVTGNLKYDVRAREATVMTGRIASLLGGTRLVVAGSTLAGEEEMVLRAWSGVIRRVEDVVLLIAPRHTNRFDEVEGVIRRGGFGCVRCSGMEGEIAAGTVLLLDTIGDLASVYSLARVAFVGGSLVAKGGHNPLEAAQFGVPVVMGKSWENFREIVGAMIAGDAVRIVGEGELEGALVELLEDDGGLGERGQAVFEGQAGATGRTLEALLEVLR